MKLLLIILLLTTVNAWAKEPKRLINEFGNFKQVNTIDLKIPKKFKAVFDVYTSNDDIDTINRGINTVARFLNMHFDSGVLQKNMKTALVIHGAAGKDLLNNAAYNEHFNSDNPNASLLKKLHENGVKIILCGQTKEYRGYKNDEIFDFVEVSLSAITALLSLQSDGYGIINFN